MSYIFPHIKSYRQKDRKKRKERGGGLKVVSVLKGGGGEAKHFEVILTWVIEV